MLRASVKGDTLHWYTGRGARTCAPLGPPPRVQSNRCVGCGESGHYLRYHIVPSCYRRHFPLPLKSHRSHDIVLLCIDCHEQAHRAAERLKRCVSAEMGVPLLPPDSKVLLSGDLQDAEAGRGVQVTAKQVQTAAAALVR